MTDILAFGAHPDDLEFACGGILAKMAAQGKSIVMCDLTLGEKGTNGTPDIRRKESENASSLIGAKRLFLDFSDCQIQDDYEGRLKLVRVIREVKPKLVLAPLWEGTANHPDHLATGSLARAACRFARFRKILPDIAPHKVDGILHYLPPSAEKTDFIIDVSDHVEIWKEMMRTHTSQMDTFPYDEWNLRFAAKLGMLIDVPYAQGLVKGTPIVIDDIMQISCSIREI